MQKRTTRIMVKNEQCLSEKDRVIEDDWSSYMQESSLHGFVNYDIQTVELLYGLEVIVKSVVALTPLDMVALSCGSHDPTGCKIWMGALFFAYAFPRLDAYAIFAEKQVMELGCGTGFSGIALTKLLKRAGITPSGLILTDGDMDSVQLCQENCNKNLHDCDRVSVRQLDWTSGFPEANRFETIFATDVVYDISMIDPLLSTVNRFLLNDGYFILSHVPRASLSGESSIATAEAIEKYIAIAALKHSLHMVKIIRAGDLNENFSKKHQTNISKMEQVGAALLLFVKGND